MTLRGRLGSAKIAVLTITGEEFAAAQRILVAPVQVPGYSYYVPAVSATHDYDLVLHPATDRTNNPAAEAVADLVEYLRPEFLFVVGTAGGVQGREEIALGDVVVADYVDYSEFRKKLPGQNLPRKNPYDHPSLFLRERFASPLRRRGNWIDLIDVPRPPAAPGAGNLGQTMSWFGAKFTQKFTQLKAWFSGRSGQVRAPVPAAGGVLPKAVEGNILAGEKVWGDPGSEELQELLTEFDKAVAVDTESYGVARAVCWRRTAIRGYNPQYLVIRGISDFVNTAGNEAQRRAWTGYAAVSASAFAKRLVDDLLASAIWQ